MVVAKQNIIELAVGVVFIGIVQKILQTHVNQRSTTMLLKPTTKAAA